LATFETLRLELLAPQLLDTSIWRILRLVIFRAEECDPVIRYRKALEAAQLESTMQHVDQCWLNEDERDAGMAQLVKQFGWCAEISN